jgi:hypothetical protein
MSLESPSNDVLCLLFSRLIEGEAGEREFAMVEMLFRTEPAAMDAYFDILETHAILHWGMGAPSAKPEQQHRSCAIPGRADLVAVDVVLHNWTPETVAVGRASTLRSPQTESAPKAVPVLRAYDACLSRFPQH